MKNREAAFGFLLVLVAISGVSTGAQTPVVLDTNPPPAAPAPNIVKRFGTASANYNKYKDTTFASSTQISLKLPNSGWGHLSAGFSSKGDGVVKPELIKLHIFTAAKDRAFVDKPHAYVFADGVRLFDGVAEITDARTNGSDVYTSFEIPIPLGDFVKIVKAEKFTLAIGPSGWFVSKEELSKFNDLVGLFGI